MGFCLKITSLHTRFPSAWLHRVFFTFTHYIFHYMIYLPRSFCFFNLPLCPYVHAFVLVWPLFSEYMLFLSIRTQYRFRSGAGSRRNIWRLICTLRIVDSDVLSEVTFIRSPHTHKCSWKGQISNRSALWSHSTSFISRVLPIQWQVSPPNDWPENWIPQMNHMKL